MLESFYNPYPLFISQKNTIKPFYTFVHKKTHFLREILLFSIAKKSKARAPKTSLLGLP